MNSDDVNFKRYRVKELNGKFTIEVYDFAYVSGRFLSIKKDWRWSRADNFGTRESPRIPISNICQPFDSLEKAKEQIKKWEAIPIYHYID